LRAQQGLSAFSAQLSLSALLARDLPLRAALIRPACLGQVIPRATMKWDCISKLVVGKQGNAIPDSLLPLGISWRAEHVGLNPQRAV
jgi:hypothetical protein